MHSLKYKIIKNLREYAYMHTMYILQKHLLHALTEKSVYKQ